MPTLHLNDKEKVYQYKQEVMELYETRGISEKVQRVGWLVEQRRVLRLKVSEQKVSELKVCETKGILRLKVAIDDQIWSPLQL